MQSWTHDAGCPLKLAYRTHRGSMWCGTAEEFLSSKKARRYHGKIQLIFTSPPFPLNRKKKYGNLRGQAYIDWLAAFAPRFRQLLKPNGSVVVEMGNAWEPGQPVMSTLALRTLLALLDAGRFHLCQQFVYENPARLPSPVEWVNVQRIRVKDSFTHLWWMAPSARPKADNRRVLKAYSDSMVKLLARQQQKTGPRPSGHCIGNGSFYRHNCGAIPSNVLTAANTRTNDDYQEYCRSRDLTPHPARMPLAVAEFFVRLLTTPGDIVFDPFGGSNTTGAAAEKLQRRWLSLEARADYASGSRGRFGTKRGG